MVGGMETAGESDDGDAGLDTGVLEAEGVAAAALGVEGGDAEGDLVAAVLVDEVGVVAAGDFLEGEAEAEGAVAGSWAWAAAKARRRRRRAARASERAIFSIDVERAGNGLKRFIGWYCWVGLG